MRTDLYTPDVAVAAHVRSDKGRIADLAGERYARLDRTLMLVVALALFAFYIAIQRGEYVSWDGRAMASVAKNIWEHGHVESFGSGFPDEVNPYPRISIYGVGVPLMLAPLWGLQTQLDPRGAQWLTVANPIVLAACGAVLYRTGVEIGLRRATSVGIAFVFGGLTMAPMYSTELFAEPAVTLGTVLAVLGCVRWRRAARSGPWLVGLGTAWSMLFRADTILLVGIVICAVPLFVPGARVRATVRQWLPALAMPIALAAGWLAYYNNLRYGSPFKDSYGSGTGFANPLLDGLERQLVSPGKGFFWYDPILIAALPGLVWLFRRDRALGTLLIGLGVLRVLLYAKWPFPDGSIAWGPRFLLPWCALLVIPLGVTWERMLQWSGWNRFLAGVGMGLLAALSVVVVVASLWVPYTQYWGAVNDATGLPPDRARAIVDRRISDSYNTISGSPLVVNLGELDDAKPLGLRWFRGGPTPFGVLALTVAMGAGGLAVATAIAADRRKRTTRSGRLRLQDTADSPAGAASEIAAPGTVASWASSPRS
jgi:hypothetical protein